MIHTVLGDDAFAHFFALSGEPVDLDLERRRDALFERYGHIRRFVGRTTRCSVSHDPTGPDGPGVGCLGDLVVPEDGRGFADLLNVALSHLRSRGCRVVRAAISRHTWYPFRVVTDGFDAFPRLSGEPWNVAGLPALLTEAGFTRTDEYVSTWTHDSTAQIERSEAKRVALDRLGYRVRSFDPSRPMDELAVIHQVTHRAFAPPFNTMFRPLAFEEMAAVLGGAAGRIDPGLFRICETDAGEAVGFVYVTREAPDVASVKTLAVDRAHASAGIGSALVAMAHAACRERGLTRVIHALMRDGGPSVSISRRGDHEVFRRYALFERPL